MGRPVTRSDVIVVVAILALALALRLWRLGAVPPGLHVDEAHNGVDALAIWRGARPIYLTSNNGREAMLSYLQAVTVGLAGPTVWALRLASALVGTAAVGVSYGFARAAAPSRPRLVAAATALLMAVSVWPLHFSRIAIRGVLMPLVGGWFAWALWRAAAGARDAGGAGGNVGTGAAGPVGRGIDERRGGGTSEHGTGRGRGVWERTVGQEQGSSLQRWRPWVVAGVALGAALYAHPAARLMPLVPVLFLGGRALGAWRQGQRGVARDALIGLAAVAATAAVVAAPLLAYAVTHRDVFFGHSVAVSVLEADNRSGGLVRRLVLTTARTFRAFVWDGSDSWYHNVRGRPVFDGVTAVMAVVGLVVLASGAWRRRLDRSVTAFVACWLFALALPAVLTGGAPNFSRSVGLLPIAFFIPAVGYAAAAASVEGWWRARRGTSVRSVAAVVLAALLVPAAASTLRDYFGRYAEAPEAAVAFGAATRAKADALRALAADGSGRVFPSMVVVERSVYRFLLDGVDLTPIDARGGYVFPADGRAWLVFDADADSDALQATLDRWPWLKGAPELGMRGWRTLRVPPIPDVSGSGIAGRGRFDGMVLQAVTGGASCSAPSSDDDLLLCADDDRSIDLRFLWFASAPPTRDWTAFAHLIDPDGHTVAQHDGVPLAGSLPTSRWRMGDTVLDRYTLQVPDGVTAGRYRLLVGWYDPATGERLGLAGDADGAADVASVRVR